MGGIWLSDIVDLACSHQRQEEENDPMSYIASWSGGKDSCFAWTPADDYKRLPFWE